MHLEKEKFNYHNAEIFPLNHIIDFAKFLEVGITVDLVIEGGDACDLCGESLVDVIEEGSVGYDEGKGFFIINEDNFDDEYRFNVIQYSKCGHWFTNIEKIK